MEVNRTRFNAFIVHTHTHTQTHIYINIYLDMRSVINIPVPLNTSKFQEAVEELVLYLAARGKQVF